MSRTPALIVAVVAVACLGVIAYSTLRWSEQAEVVACVKKAEAMTPVKVIRTRPGDPYEKWDDSPVELGSVSGSSARLEAVEAC